MTEYGRKGAQQGARDDISREYRDNSDDNDTG